MPMQPLQPHARRRRRRRRAGIALTESLIVTTVMIAFFSGIWFLHGLHDRKGDTLRAARYQAWTATRPGCSGSVQGHEARTMRVPFGSSTGPEQPRELSVTSATQMRCNERPNPSDDVISVIEWATGNGLDAIVRPAIDALIDLLPF